MFGKLRSDEIEQVLGSQIVGRIGTHTDGLTYVVPISYAYDGIYLYGRSLKGMKIDMMRKNKNVCFQVDEMHDMANWKSVIAWGEFEELTAPPERNQALQRLMDRHLPIVSSQTVHLTAEWPFPEKEIGAIEGIVFRVKLNRKTGRFEHHSVSVP